MTLPPTKESGIPPDDYIGQLEAERDALREALDELTCYVEVDALHPDVQDRISAALERHP